MHLMDHWITTTPRTNPRAVNGRVVWRARTHFWLWARGDMRQHDFGEG